MCTALGFVTAAFFINTLSTRIGRAKTLVIGQILLMLGYGIVIITPPFPAVAASYVCQPFSLSLYLLIQFLRSRPRNGHQSRNRSSFLLEPCQQYCSRRGLPRRLWDRWYHWSSDCYGTSLPWLQMVAILHHRTSPRIPQPHRLSLGLLGLRARDPRDPRIRFRTPTTITK